MFRLSESYFPGCVPTSLDASLDPNAFGTHPGVPLGRIQACVWDDPAYQPAAARHSFPSGHSSLTISAGLLVTLYALGVLPAMQPTLHPSISTWGNRHHYVRCAPRAAAP